MERPKDNGDGNIGVFVIQKAVLQKSSYKKQNNYCISRGMGGLNIIYRAALTSLTRCTKIYIEIKNPAEISIN